MGHGVRVTVGGMAIRASWRARHGMWVTARVTMCMLHYVACGVRALCVCVCRNGEGVTTWVTLCGWWCHGHDVWITLRGKHYVADAVQMTLRGSWCVSIHTRVKTQFRST